MRLRTALLMLTFATTARAADDGAVSWVVLGGGGSAPAEGARALLEADEAMRSANVAAPGYPRRIVSDEVGGLKAGFHLAVLGTCATEAEALTARDRLRTALPGAYVRRVVTTLPRACPARVPPPMHAPKVEDCVEDEVVAGDASPRWELATLRETASCSAQPDAVSLRVRLVANGAREDVVTYTVAHGTRPAPDDSGETWTIRTRAARVVAQVPSSPLPILVVGETTEPDGEHGSTQYEALSSCRGRIVRTPLFTCGFGAASTCRLDATLEGTTLRVRGSIGTEPSATASVRVACEPAR